MRREFNERLAYVDEERKKTKILGQNGRRENQITSNRPKTNLLERKKQKVTVASKFPERWKAEKKWKKRKVRVKPTKGKKKSLL